MINRHPLLVIAVLFAAGIGLAETLTLPLPLVFLFSFLFIGSSWIMNKKPIAATLLLSLSAMGAGFLHGALQKQAVVDPTLKSINTYSKIWVAGTVESPVTYWRTGCQFDLHLMAVKGNQDWQPARGIVRVTIQAPPKPLHWYEVLLIRSNLVWPLAKRNPGELNRRRYLQTYGIQATLRGRDDALILPLAIRKPPSLPLGYWAFMAQNYLRKTIQQVFDPEVTAVIQALLLGDRNSIDADTRETFARSGIIHVLAVSGLHVGFIMLIFMAISAFLRIPRRSMLSLIIVGIWGYAWITGLRPPVLRASIMATLILVGHFRDRPSQAPNILAAAALIVLLLRPGELFQVGFQLTFAAVAGILYAYPKIEAGIQATRIGRIGYRFGLSRWAITLGVVSLAAQIGTLPFTSFHFGRISLVGLFANLFAIPAIFLAVATGFITLAIFPFLKTVALDFAAVTNFTLLAVLRLTKFLSAQSFASLDNWYPESYSILAFILIVTVLFEWRRKKIRVVAIAGLFILANFQVWSAVITGPPGLAVTILDVGQGDATFIQFPRGQTLLIDAGPASPYSDAGERIILPFLYRQGVHKIDMAIITHPHADHFGGFFSLNQAIAIRKIILPDSAYPVPAFQKLLRSLRRHGSKIQIARRGDILNDFAPAQLYVFGPDANDAKMRNRFNNASFMIQLRYGKTAFLFTGDTEFQGEIKALPFGSLLKSEVLKVGHHGSDTSTSEAFLLNVKPRWSTLSLGAFNKFDHPSPVVTKRLAHFGSDTLRTDLAGAIIFKSDGYSIKIEK